MPRWGQAVGDAEVGTGRRRWPRWGQAVGDGRDGDRLSAMAEVGTGCRRWPRWGFEAREGANLMRCRRSALSESHSAYVDDLLDSLAIAAGPVGAALHRLYLGIADGYGRAGYSKS